MLRTSAFRLTLTYAWVFALSVLMLFAIVEWSATGFMRRQIDQTVGNEVTEVIADAAAPGSPGLAGVIDELTRHSPGLVYLLQDASGRALAGNLAPLRAIAGTRELGERHGRIRGRGTLLPSGRYLFVGMSDLELREMREAIARAFAAGFAVVLMLSAAGGLLTSRGVLRRLEAISQASREIMAGDLARRIEIGDSGDEFDHLGASLNAMLERIEALMAGLQQVSSDIAHDLRTPLSRLRQRLERALAIETTEAGLREALSAAIAEADAILATFAALLRIVQVESGSRRAAFRQVELSELLVELADAYAPVAAERTQRIECAVETGLVAFGDRELLQQMFANLIENAIRHTPEGTPITVAASGSQQVEVSIADRGPGIPSASRDQVLMPFFRLDASRTTPGSGLGLGLVAAIATLHEASLTLEDNKPGLRCRILLASRFRPAAVPRGTAAGRPKVPNATSFAGVVAEPVVTGSILVQHFAGRHRRG